MSDAKTASSAPKRGWLRKLVWVAGGLVVLLVIAYFVVTSGGFVKSVILPKVGAGLNADLSAADVDLSPFSQIVLRDLKLTPKGKETLLTASLVRARYSLFDIIGGKINVDEVTVENPTVTLVQNADGTSNLDPLMQGAKKAEAKPKESGEPAQVDIKTVALKNATVKITQHLPGGGIQTVELANVNLTAADIKNGASGKLDLGAALALDNTATNAAAKLAATLNGNFTFDLTPALMPSKLSGKATVKVDRASGAAAELATAAVTLDTEVSPTEIKQLSVRFTKNGQELGEVRVNGPFDASKMEGKLNAAILSLDRRVLNLAGAASGIDFGTTLINSTNTIELSNAGAVIAVTGQLDAARVQITRTGTTTPTLDLRASYAVNVDNNAKSAQIRTLNVTGTQDSRPLLQTDLTSPMTIAWGNANNAVGDATLNVVLTRLNLADWRAFAPDLSPAGTASATLKLVSQQGGKQLAFDLDFNATELSAKLGSNSLNQADIGLRVRGSGLDMKQFKLDEYLLTLAQRGQPVARVAGSGTFDAATQDVDIQVALNATVARVLSLFPQPDAAFSNGTIEFNGRAVQKAKQPSLTGKFALTGLTGHFGTTRFNEFATTADLDVAMKGAVAEIRKATVELKSGANAGGKADVSGTFDTERKAGQLALSLVNFNEHGLRPFLESALGDKKLVSVSLNTTANAKFEANGDATVKADLQLANLIVNDPSGAIPKTPLEAKANLDFASVKSVAQLKQCEVTLTPTDRASNKLNLTGTVDYSKTNAFSGSLKLGSDGLDVTRYYDLFAGTPKSATAATTPAAAPTPWPDKEPEPVTLPASNFTFEASIAKFYLREVAVTNFQFVAKVDGGRLALNPAQFVVNGAPVKANVALDLSVPGYRYNVTLDAQPIPLEPFVNTFMPERKGQLKGVTVANAKIKGAGITGANLKKNLNGDFSFASTNLNLEMQNLKTKAIKELVNFVVAIPELVKNSGGVIQDTVARWTGRSTKGSFTDEVLARPIETIRVRGRVANGTVTLEQADIFSSAFEAFAPGKIELADKVEHSKINFPVELSLARAFAEKAGLAGNIPTNQVMVKLPHLLTMGGTIDDPKRQLNYLEIGKLALKATGGIANQFGVNIGEKAQGVFNAIIGGGNQATTNSTSTNAVAKTNSPVGNLLRGLGGLLQQPAAAPTSAPTATNKPAPPQ